MTPKKSHAATERAMTLPPSDLADAIARLGNDLRVLGNISPDQAVLMLRASDALRAMQPTGEWVLVPREPTQEMREAADDSIAFTWNEDGSIADVDLTAVYRAMLAAAPPHSPQPTGGDFASGVECGIETAAGWHESQASEIERRQRTDAMPPSTQDILVHLDFAKAIREHGARAIGRRSPEPDAVVVERMARAIAESTVEPKPNNPTQVKDWLNQRDIERAAIRRPLAPQTIRSRT